jgi:hypothetical protein
MYLFFYLYLLINLEVTIAIYQASYYTLFIVGT